MVSSERRIAIDSSAWVAIRSREPGYELLFEKVTRADTVLVSAPTVLEIAIVLTRRFLVDPRPSLTNDFDTYGVQVVPLNKRHSDVAIHAFLKYGKGRHPARLNFGDCLSYAVASLAGLPLLYTGDDFSKTDIEAA
jgi:ribonuclease VapC